MLEQLQDHLSRVVKNIKGKGKITESNISETMRDIRIALLEADVSLSVAKKFVEHVKEKALGDKVLNAVSPGQQFTKILHDELCYFLGDESHEINFNDSGITIIVLAGLQGCGKTTTAAKLARFLKTTKGKNPLLIAADLQRPAAIDQLIKLGKSIDVEVFNNKKKSPEAVVKEGFKYANKDEYDTVIVDTAGRLHIDDEMMSELSSVVNIETPHEILFVADGMSGQDAVNSAKTFNEKLNLSGIVLTKMDGDSKGGAALSVKEVIGKPIKFVGTGESIDALDQFHPDRFSSRILGMGDVISLVEKAQSVIDKESIDDLEEKLASNTFSLIDFQNQIKQIKKMGSLSKMIEMIPGAKKIKLDNINDDSIKWVEAIISSMTKEERLNPDCIDGSRRKRIANGSGRPIREVNSLLKQYKQMKMMMKKVGKNKGKFNFPFNINN